MAFVSILIPCRNAVATLRETLESALAQEGVEKEVIVVDDGSTDGSLELARNYEPRGVRVIEGPRINASAARNRALAASRGDYIQYLDADDLLGANKISKQIELLERRPDCVATARWGRFRETVQDVVFANDNQLHDWMPVEWLIAHCSRHQMMHPAAWLVPRSIAQAAGPWNERLTLNDDGEYFARIVAKSRKLKCGSESESFYRTLESGSLSKTRGHKAFDSLWLSTAGTISAMMQLENSARTRGAAADACQRFIYEVFPSVPRLRRLARLRVTALGGSQLKPDFGPRSRRLASLLGWGPVLIAVRLARKGTAI